MCQWKAIVCKVERERHGDGPSESRSDVCARNHVATHAARSDAETRSHLGFQREGKETGHPQRLVLSAWRRCSTSPRVSRTTSPTGSGLPADRTMVYSRRFLPECAPYPLFLTITLSSNQRCEGPPRYYRT